MGIKEGLLYNVRLDFIIWYPSFQRQTKFSTKQLLKEHQC